MADRCPECGNFLDHAPWCDRHPKPSGSERERYPDCQKWPHLAVDCRGDWMPDDHDPATPEPTDSWPCATCGSSDHNGRQHDSGFSVEQFQWDQALSQSTDSQEV